MMGNRGLYIYTCGVQTVLFCLPVACIVESFQVVFQSELSVTSDLHLLIMAWWQLKIRVIYRIVNALFCAFHTCTFRIIESAKRDVLLILSHSQRKFLMQKKITGKNREPLSMIQRQSTT